MLSAMVLAAGIGSRLRPLTDILPKPLVPVGDRPALAHALDRFAEAGLRRVVVNAHHGAEAILRFAATRPHLLVSYERELLGTAGGVARAAALLGGGDVLLWNADILAAVDGATLLAAHAGGHLEPASRRAATLVVQPRPCGHGSVGLDDAGRVVRLRGERIAEESTGGEFLGIHVLGERLRAALPERGCLVGDTYIPAMKRGEILQAFLWEEPFFDIGSVRTYLDANLAWLASRGLTHWAGEGACVGSAVRLEQTLVGQGAIVEGHGALERCVVWPGVAVEAPLADAVVLPGHVVRAGSC